MNVVFKLVLLGCVYKVGAKVIGNSFNMFIIDYILQYCTLKSQSSLPKSKLLQPLTPEEGQAMFLDILNNCKASEGASEDDALGIITHSIPSTQAGGCLNICVMEKTGIVSRY